MTGRLRLACLVIAVLLPAWLLRTVLLSRVASGRLAFPGDAAGFIADLGLAAIVSALVFTLLRRSRAAGSMIVLVWLVVQLISYESVRALDALPSLRDAGYLTDATFVLGSGLQLFAPGWPLVAIGLSLWLCWVGRLARATPKQVAVVFVSGALFLGLHTAIGWSPDIADWRQTHALLHDWAGAPESPSATVPAAIASDLALDLSGERAMAAPLGTPNVLLVLVESASAAYLPSLARVHGQEAKPRMPELDAFALRHRSFSTFVTHQVNTNRGLYAALCGDLPKLLPGTPKMSVHAATGLTTCLPRLLRDAGYYTAYLQAAPLAFMLKDQFLPRIGFQEVRGDLSFAAAAARSAWGVDDATLFRAGLALVRRLRAAEGPWFATLLSVGTHHPYLVPATFEPERENDFTRAILYADREVGRLLAALEAMGVFEDTLVLVSSDESRGRRDSGDALSRLVSQNWGLLIAAGPGIGSARVDAPFGLSDLPASVLDYLSRGEDAARAGLLGRSVFRRYSDPRYVFFANSRRGSAGAIDPFGRLLLCRKRFERCEAFEVPDGVFGATRRPASWSESNGGVVGSVARWSLVSGASASDLGAIELMAERKFVLPDAEPRMLHGGQNVELRDGEWIEVELDVTAGPRVGVELKHTLKGPLEVRLDLTRRLAPGSRMRLHYAFVPDPGLGRTQCLTVAKPLRERSGELDFKVARMLIRSTGERPPSGVTILTDEIEPRHPGASRR
ncbi:MAG: LTA synthase family protein [Myxococcota bacterium]|nr:LTA synthase family protein [Myxococcota bacterium]